MRLRVSVVILWGESGCAENTTFGAAVLLLRNPFDAFVAEWNRQKVVALNMLTLPTRHNYFSKS